MDAAFGGFIFPIVTKDPLIGFGNQHVSSITLDAHKMLQAPFGTGIFLARKGLIDHVLTSEAKYINGMDVTLSGSRSGANAIAIWMILHTHGHYGWLEKLLTLLYRTDRFCAQLDELGFRYYRHPKMNIVTLRAEDISKELANEYGLVPDSHGQEETRWYKIVFMEHVEMEILESFISKLAHATKTIFKI